MDVGSIMTKWVVTVGLDSQLRRIIEIFSHAKFHHLLVMDRGRLCGVISDRDVLKASSPFLHTRSEEPRDLATLNRKAHQIMHRHPVTTQRNVSVEAAMRLLLQKDVSSLPVLSPDGKVEGIVTLRDLIQAHLKEQPTADQ